MGLLDKLKSTFFEEEYIEVEEDDEPIARKVEVKTSEPVLEEDSDTLKELDEIENEEVETNISLADKDLYKNDSIQYFDDDDFSDESSEPIEEKQEETKVYGGETPKKLYEPEYETEGPYKPYATQPQLNKFKPTPIISPIYGVLDKNYKKEEIQEKKDRPSSYVSRKNVDLDFVRNKAFGTQKLEDDIMFDSFSNTSDESDIDRFNDEPEEENLLIDITESDCPAVDKVTLADAEEYFEDLGLEYNVDYKDKHYEKATGRRTKSAKEEEKVEKTKKKVSKETMEVIEELAMKAEETEEEESAKIDDLIEESKNFEDPKDNLFDLIDSMYEEEDNEEEE